MKTEISQLDPRIQPFIQVLLDQGFEIQEFEKGNGYTDLGRYPEGFNSHDRREVIVFDLTESIPAFYGRITHVDDAGDYYYDRGLFLPEKEGALSYPITAEDIQYMVVKMEELRAEAPCRPWFMEKCAIDKFPARPWYLRRTGMISTADQQNVQFIAQIAPHGPANQLNEEDQAYGVLMAGARELLEAARYAALNIGDPNHYNKIVTTLVTAIKKATKQP